MQLNKEKVDLENRLEAEQEYVVNKLCKQVRHPLGCCDRTDDQTYQHPQRCCWSCFETVLKLLCDCLALKSKWTAFRSSTTA